MSNSSSPQDPVNRPIRVVIVDDHRIITDSLSAVITNAGDIDIVGKAYCVDGCRKILAQNLPDVLLLDVNLPDGNGIELCAEINKQYPALKILMLTSYAGQNVIGRAFDGGAQGYVLKNAASNEIIEGIRAVVAGHRFLCRESATMFKERMYQPVSLSPKEREVLKLIVEGYTIKEISEKLFLGFETVRSYHKYLHLKLNVHNTAQLVRLAIEQKLV